MIIKDLPGGWYVLDGDGNPHAGPFASNKAAYDWIDANPGQKTIIGRTIVGVPATRCRGDG